MKKDNIVINKKKFIIIIAIFIIILASTITTCIILFNNTDNRIDTSNFTDKEVIEYLESLGYKYDKTMYSNLLSTTYITITDKKDDIRIQKIINDFVGTSYTFQNSSYNDSHADILNIEDNDDEEKIQYSAYNKWLKEINLSDSQVISSINYYDKNNEVKIIDVDDLLDYKDNTTDEKDGWTTYTVENIKYQVPSSWFQREAEEGNYHYPNIYETNELLYVSYYKANAKVAGVTIMETEKVYDDVINGIKKSSQNFTLINKEDINIEGTPCKKISYYSTIENSDYYLNTYLLYNFNDDNIYNFTIGIDKSEQDNVNQNINEIINSIEIN